MSLTSVLRVAFPRGGPSCRRLLSGIAGLDDGLIITKSCAQRIKAMRKSANNPTLSLRVTVEGGGCSGFQYVFNMDDAPANKEEDLVFEKDGSQVLVDSTSLELIKGATIDYQQELIRNAFAVVNNPQSESACGCGSSFAVKAFTSNPATD